MRRVIRVTEEFQHFVRGLKESFWGDLYGYTQQLWKKVLVEEESARLRDVYLGLAFLRSQGESQAAWEGLLQDLYRRGWVGHNLLLIVTDGCPGLAAALQTVYPRVEHQRCWVHKMRNILEHVRERDYEAVKAEAQAIYGSSFLNGTRKDRSKDLQTRIAHWGDTGGCRRLLALFEGVC